MSDPSVYQPGVDDLPTDEVVAEKQRNRRRVCSIQGKYPDPNDGAVESRKFRETYQQKLWREHYGKHLPPEIEIDYLDLRDLSAVRAKLGGGEVMVDTGDVIHLRRGSDDGPSDASIAAMIACAKAKGWERLKVEGSESFKYRSCVQWVAQGGTIDWEGSGIDDETRAKIEAEAAELRTGIGNGDDVPGISAAPVLGLSLDDFADQLRAPHRESADAMRERLEADEAKRKEAKEAAVVDAEKRDQAINDVMAEGLGDHMPGGDERRARASKPRMR